MSAADKKQAIEDIKFLARRFKGILAAADDIASLGPLDKAIAGAAERLDKLRAEASELQASIKTLTQQKLDAEGVKATAVQVASDAVQAIIATAEQTAAALVEEAKQDAAKTTASARKAERAAAAKVEAAETELSQLNAAIASANDELARVERIRDEAKAKLLGGG
jgi:chromosome segregation ATPase